MREIKFRAWDCPQWSYFTIGQTWTTSMQSVYNDHCLNGRQFYLFTGLHDKNGKEIYEGDILVSGDHLRWGKPNYAAVVFENGAFLWHGVPLGFDEENITEPVGTDWAIVSGNIHQNPELLK